MLAKPAAHGNARRQGGLYAEQMGAYSICSFHGWRVPRENLVLVDQLSWKDAENFQVYGSLMHSTLCSPDMDEYRG